MDAKTTTANKPIKKRRQAESEEEETRPARAAAPEEEEVEEFFAILRRIHVAVKYFEKSGAEAGSLLSGKRWRPSFEKEDFVEIDDLAAVGDCDEAGSEVEGAGLDLNSDPPPDLTNDDQPS
ncbi:unnamed protein product [Linum tenue]|uniref:Uncharacterized protein n=1 Tax=Linum tenue TaxID=586396 RepID=A0AAV0NKJ6_9ROSI|nr:unnamed protein product [Linum tenue]